MDTDKPIEETTNPASPESQPPLPADEPDEPTVVDETPASLSPATPAPPETTSEPAAPVQSSTPPAASTSTHETFGSTPIGGIVTGGSSHGPTTFQPAAAATPGRHAKKWLKPALIAVLAVLVIGGGSAAAYFGYVVPNKPQNVLMSAFLNTAQQKHVTFNGTLHEQPAKGTGVAVAADYNGQADAASKAADMQMKLTISGVDFTVDVRYVGKDLYIKLGDLKTIVSLLNGFDPSYGAMAKSLSSQVSNKWIKIDRTILDESQPVSCVLNTNFGLTDQDIDLLKTQYKQHPFMTIQSTASDTVNGKKVEKFVLSLDDDKMATFSDHVQGLSMIKALEKCDTSKADTSTLADHDHTPLTVWVDKGSKQIVQVASRTTAQDAKKSNLKGDTTVTLDYDKPVNITAPSSSVPVMQLLGSIEQGFTSTSSPTTPTPLLQ